jgi:hypothetical protein
MQRKLIARIRYLAGLAGIALLARRAAAAKACGVFLPSAGG